VRPGKALPIRRDARVTPSPARARSRVGIAIAIETRNHDRIRSRHRFRCRQCPDRPTGRGRPKPRFRAVVDDKRRRSHDRATANPRHPGSGRSLAAFLHGVRRLDRGVGSGAFPARGREHLGHGLPGIREGAKQRHADPDAAGTIAAVLNAEGLARALLSDGRVPLPLGWRRNQARMFRESGEALGD